MSFTIWLAPTPRVWRGEERIDLGTAAADCDIVLDFPCGGRGQCGKCRVRAPTTAISQHDLNVLGAADAAAGWRLGCHLELHTDTRVELPNIVSAGAIKSFGADDILPAPVITARPSWGFAVDIGTTTLAAALVDLRDGRVAGTVSAANPQIVFGADVMTRIAFARERSDGNAELNTRLVGALNGMFSDLLRDAGLRRSDVTHAVLVGNTTMLHTLVGLDVSPLGEAPFEGRLQGDVFAPAGRLGLEMADDAVAWCPPVIHSHVGADLLANIIATDIDRGAELTLLIDLGTNTEMVLASREGITVTSASGGPAFEAGSIRCGMRAIPGAIDQLKIDPHARIRMHTVGHANPIGVCGSGLLDGVAEMLRLGIVEGSGRMCASEELSADLHPLARRIINDAYGRALWVAGPQDDPVVISAIDVRQLQLVKASIAAAATLLLEHAGRSLTDVTRIYVAGAFGNYINKTSAQMVGLLPDVDPEIIHFVGHTAGIGARMLLVSDVLRERAIDVARRAGYVDLAGHEGYQSRFIEALAFNVPVAAVA